MAFPQPNKKRRRSPVVWLRCFGAGDKEEYGVELDQSVSTGESDRRELQGLATTTCSMAMREHLPRRCQTCLLLQGCNQEHLRSGRR
jgi:hypothetical protein